MKINIEKSNIYVARSLRLTIINWTNLFLSLYLPYLYYTTITIVISLLLKDLYQNLPDYKIQLLSFYSTTLQNFTTGTFFLCIFCFLVVLLFLRKDCPVYLIDFSVWEPPESWKVSHEELVELMRLRKCFEPESIDFMKRILANGGTGNTAFPPSIRARGEETTKPTIDTAREEFETIIFSLLSDLFEKTKTNPKSIDFLIINCSLFAPTPSLCSIVANHFKMSDKLQSYNLGGMGCSASIISIDLAKQLLRANSNCTALVVSTENISKCLYLGNDRSFLLQNTLFRSGGAAILLSNKLTDGFRAKYKLLHTVRIQRNDNESYSCVYESNDSAGFQGVRLSKDLIGVAGKALQDNLTVLGPFILPFREQAKVVINIAGRQFLRKLKNFLEKNHPKWSDHVTIPPYYIPDFKRAIHYFCIHAGGRAVIEGVEKNLNLTPEHVEPSKKTLFNYGNTSSSSIWYELDYIEKNTSIRRGNTVLQIAFGSGFKCNSAVWLRIKN